MFALKTTTIILCLSYTIGYSTDIYVVPADIGNQQPDGTLEKPFPTIQKALDYLRSKPSTAIRRVALYQTYHFVNKHTVTLDDRDSSVIFTSMTGSERQQFLMRRSANLIELDIPIISGGIRLKGWTDFDGIWKVRIPVNMSVVTQLFVNGRRAIRSRVPSVGYYKYQSGLDNSTELAFKGFIYYPNQFGNITLSSLSPTEFIIYHSYSTSRHYYSKHFPEKRTILFSNAALSIIGNSSISHQSGNRFHIENVYEAMLQEVGSYYYDAQNRTLYYHPRSNEMINNTTFILPVKETVVAFVDTTNIVWENIGVEHGGWLTESVFDSTVTIDGRAGADYLNRFCNAIYVRNSSHIVFSNIRIAHTACYGLQIDERSKEITITGSALFDLGAGGIRTGINQTKPNMSEILIRNVTISNCSLYDGGHLFPMAVAILIQQATEYHSIVRNTIHAFQHSAIHVGWSWSYASSYCTRHIISFNYIHHVGQYVLSDLGGIYTCGLQNETIIKNNVLHDIYGYYLSDWGLYLADGTSQLLILNNIMYNTGSASVSLVYGFNNTLLNNVLARQGSESDGALSLYRRESLDHLSFTFSHNIVYDTVSTSGRWIFQVQAPDPFSAPYTIMDFNNYFSSYNAMFIFGLGRLVFSEWQETNHDADSYIIDPEFINVHDKCDFFHLNPSSPAITKVGFKPIEPLPQWIPGCSS